MNLDKLPLKALDNYQIPTHTSEYDALPSNKFHQNTLSSSRGLHEKPKGWIISLYRHLTIIILLHVVLMQNLTFSSKPIEQFKKLCLQRHIACDK